MKLDFKFFSYYLMYEWTNFFASWRGQKAGATNYFRQVWIKNFFKQYPPKKDQYTTYVSPVFLKAVCLVEGVKWDGSVEQEVTFPQLDYEVFLDIMAMNYGRMGHDFYAWFKSVPAEKRDVVGYFSELTGDSKIGYKIGMGWIGEEASPDKIEQGIQMEKGGGAGE